MSLANDVKISQIQDCFRAAGFQWQEHIFNDDLVNFGNCMIELTQDKSPHAFSSFPRPEDTVGWGRFDRATAWEMAYEWLVLRTAKTNLRPSPVEAKCVHTEHCCIYHGCKYGDKDCPVEQRRKKQSHPCEYCEENQNFPNQFESVGGNYI